MLPSVLRVLPKLKLAELEQIRKRIDFLLGTKPKCEESQDWLLEGLAVELRRRGLWTAGRIPARLIPSNYSDKSETVRQHLLKGLAEPNPRLIERMSLAGLAGSVLMDYLQKIHVPVTPKTVLINIEKMPVALEGAFPGYWSQKLLGFCIKGRV